MSYAWQSPYYPQQQPPPQNSNTLVWIVAIAVAAFLFVAHQNHSWPFQRSDQQEQDDERQVVTSDGYLVFVLERTSTTADQELVLRGVSEYVESRKLDGYRVYDDDQAEAEPYTRSGRGPPLVALVQSSKVVRTIDFPPNVKGLDALFK